MEIFYVLDLKRIAKLNLLKTYFNSLLNDNYQLSKRTYKGQEILEVFDRTTKETIHLSFIKNQLIASYTHTLVEASIDQYQVPYLGRNLDFIKINEKVGYEDEFRLYVQHEFLDDYLQHFSNESNAVIDRISNNFLFSGFHIDFEDERLVANGFTNINLAQESYLQALQNSGTSKRKIPEIAPKSTALYLSYGFEDFEQFYTNFENLLKEDEQAYTRYKEGIETTERFLKINVKENFKLDWR